MKEITQTIFKCDHCKKVYLRKHAAVNHEKYCWKNPANHYACFDCTLLEKSHVTADDGYRERVFRCTKLDKYMHSIKAEKMNHACLGYTELMPLTCEHRKDQIDDYFDNNPE